MADIKTLEDYSKLYIEKAYTYIEPDESRLRSWVDWLYTSINRTTPDILFIDSQTTHLIKDVNPFDSLDMFVKGFCRTGIGIKDWTPISKMPEFINIARHVRHITKLSPWVGQGVKGPSILNYWYMGAVMYKDYMVHQKDEEGKLFIDKLKEMYDLGVYEAYLYPEFCAIVKQPKLLIKLKHEREIVMGLETAWSQVGEKITKVREELKW